MKSKENFVNRDVVSDGSFEDILDTYKTRIDDINRYQEEKDEYEELNKQNIDECSSVFNFKEQLEIYRLVDGTIKNDNPNKYGIDLRSLRERIKWVFGLVFDYLGVIKKINDKKEFNKELLNEYITFNNFTKDNKGCSKHFLIKTNDELICANCGATTKDYDLTNEELKLLMESAEIQGLILRDAKKEDIPLIKVLIEEEDFSRLLRYQEYSKNNEDYLTNAEEEYLSEEAEITTMNCKVREARRLDAKDLYREEIYKRLNRRSITEEKAKELLSEVKKELNRVKKMDSPWFKDLMIEECKVAKYEILLLAGRHIPTLYKRIKNEEDRMAFIKAYYNLSNENIKAESSYFAKKEDIYSFNCLTANPDINNQILEMKVRR